MKSILKITMLLLISATLISCGTTNKKPENNYTPPKTSETEEPSSEEEQIPSKEYTEEEYKALCEELYNDDFFKSTPKVGKFVKVHVMASTKYKYSAYDTQGMIVKNITKKYNLAMNCLGCTVMHESTKDDATPSYFGKQIYMMFVDGAELNLDSLKTGKKYVIYGEVIQNTNGTFILLKYFETEN